MIRRCALLVVADRDHGASSAPPGVAPRAYADALIEDVADVLHGLAGVDSLLVCRPADSAAIRCMVWPDVPVIEVAQPRVRSALALAQERGYQQAAVVAADIPDLPQLVLAKIFQALGGSPVVVAPAKDGGGAVALGVCLPVPAWLGAPAAAAAVDLDRASLTEDLRAAAPDPALVAVTPGWHRLRAPADVHRLDPGLEGWERTRALLSGAVRPRPEA